MNVVELQIKDRIKELFSKFIRYILLDKPHRLMRKSVLIHVAVTGRVYQAGHFLQSVLVPTPQPQQLILLY